MFVMAVAVGFVFADTFQATITKVDGNKVTYQKYKKGAKGAKGEKDGDAVTMEAAKDAKVLKYNVLFEISEGGLREDRTVTVDVNDTRHEGTNQADAMVTATLVLDDEGIKHWTLKGVAKATS